MSDLLPVRETQILALIKEGHSCREISEKIGLSYNTVKTYRRLVIARLGARDITHAVTIALRKGYITLHEIGSK